MFASRSISTSLRQANLWRTLALPVFVAVLALGVAVVGAVLIGNGGGIDGVNLFVERLSGSSGSFLGGLVQVSALFAFAAGMVSAVNPCGFAMLPAYLGLYLGETERREQEAVLLRQLVRALAVGGTVTAGFVLLFGVAGGVIGLGASFVGQALPWLGLVIGIALAVTGSWMLGGGKLYSGIAARAASQVGDPSQVSPRGYFVFGLSYGIASLSCTLPIFLAVVGINVAGTTGLAVAANFILYALGMGLVIMALTLGMAFFKGAMVGGLRKALPYIQPVGSWLMVVAGAYIVFYWLTIGGLL